MNMSDPAQYQTIEASTSTAAGIGDQLTRFEQNVAEVARGESSDSLDSGARDRALAAQSETVRAVRANARSLEASNQAIGTILDIKV